jgi:prepilin-type N-terminal cleavage/methylation domain-containing protein
MPGNRTAAGFTVIEMLVALLIGAVVVGGTLKTLGSQSRAHDQQKMLLAMEQNLRVATDVLGDEIQFTNVGVPRFSVDTWIPWVPGFTSNPTLTTSPRTFSVASATTYPVARLKSRVAQNDTVLQVVSAVEGKTVGELLNTNQKRLISIDGEVFAHVMNVGANSLTINTQPGSKKNVGMPLSYPETTPIYRVDVRTYSVETNPATGSLALMISHNDGSPKWAIAEGISMLTVAPVGGEPVSYRLTMTASAERPDPLTGLPLTRTMSTEFAVRDYVNDFDDIGEEDEADNEEF